MLYNLKQHQIKIVVSKWNSLKVIQITFKIKVRVQYLTKPVAR